MTNYGWLVKKTEEGNNPGIIQFEAREGATVPSLIISLTSEIDLAPPTITIVEPTDQIFIETPPSQIRVSYTDDVDGVDLSSLKIFLNSVDITNDCGTPGPSFATCAITSELNNGNNLITAT